ncbi:Subtilisin-like protease SBT1.2 [Striga hermonthica]|uniref:Subtilisin-like protease SBT1.2 n=1 Tax=Striga hermonthica TaxID=68872 RepID=A0A9N7N711_STRHE|nr:Subtilisin-like protease SBT1.2 [Striga hermonthica]
MGPKKVQVLLLTVFSLLHSLSSQAHNLQTYIVQLNPAGFSASYFASKHHWHLSVLDRSFSPDQHHDSSSSSSSRLIYSYESAIEGFAAQLSPPEADALKTSKHVISVKPDRRLQIHTTYSYKFLGLSPTKQDGAWVKSGFGRGSIIGVLDTGIWPESPSFDDRGMPPVPKKWRGVCQAGQGFDESSCNRKLIGARFFSRGHRVASSTPLPEAVVEYTSPRDSHGHGTHTASTAGGSPVGSAGVLGFGAGVAQGMAPGAHLAVYKVCWFSGCYSSDILAAMDSAIRDGVDVLSLSLGGFPVPLYEDTIAIGSFRAVEHGISVVCSAGNNGPVQNSVANEAPWIATIGASTLDRKFPAVVRLGNGEYLYGESMFPGKLFGPNRKELELVYVTGGDRGSEFCLRGSLPKAKVKGKMVICDRGVNGRAEKGQIVKEAGGAAMILANTEINLEEDSVDVHVLPATLIGSDESYRLKMYMNSSRSRPKARIIFGGTVIGRSRAPAVAQFSSRGPSFTDPSILKPDVIAPGVNIIAAWPQNLGPSGLPEDSRRVNFTVMSGTSMACPHVSGVAALIHSAHPKWTPAAVKSAIMTTAYLTDHTGKPIFDGDKPAGLFATGAGHVDPGRAIDPGLVYDISLDEHVTHLCTLRYTKSDIFSITHRNVSCRELLRKNRGFSLNYPSFSVIFKKEERKKMERRVLTNVGKPNSIYSLELKAPEGVSMKVRPRRLVFKHINQTLSYRVWFMSKKGLRTKSTAFGQGHLEWVERTNSYRVRSPISITWTSTK